MSSYHLALVDLELSTNPELFSYIKSIFEPQVRDPTTTAGTSGGDKSISSRDKRKKTKKKSSELKRICEGKVEDLSESVSRRSFYSSQSLRGSQRGTLSTALCSHLPLCRKIFYKHGTGASRPRESYSSSEDSENENEDGPLERIDQRALPLEQIVGRINIDEPEDFERGRKLPKLPPGVREFSSSVSNPLYKDYNPRGYVKSEDELAREFIRDICQRFNVRMKSCFDGEPIQLDPLHMIRILRDNLEKA